MESASLPKSVAITVEEPKLKANAIGYLVERRHRGRLDRTGLQPGGDTRLHRCGRRAGLPRTGGDHRRLLPDGCIALAYNYLNKADPDCGTTFSWMTKAMGPCLGWQGGWAIVVADVLVMPNLA